MKIRYMCILLGLTLGAVCRAQDYSLSTNFAGYLNLGTMNFEASRAVARRWSVTAGMRYNPFSYDGGKEGYPMQNKQISYTVGARYWPWHIFSGWWLASNMRYQEYNSGGITSVETEEGKRLGGSLSGGYTYMLTKRLNLEFGAGFWMGSGRYVVYSCPLCGRVIDEGRRFFFLPDDVLLSLSYVF